MDAGRFAVHPGWRGRIPPGLVVVTDQRQARIWLDHALDEELWRRDRLRAARRILLTLIDAMDWRTGLITGTTREKAAMRAGVSPRTVSRAIAWAGAVGLLVCVEKGATAQFLGTRTHRAPAYVVTSRAGVPLPPAREYLSAQRVDALGNPPATCVGSQPLAGEGPKNTSHRTRTWPHRDRTRTRQDRTSATHTVLERTGLVGRVPLWRAAAMLSPWWQAGWCVSGLLYAIDHHPDRPGELRGDALRGARVPLAVLGYRLTAWRNREQELPEVLRSVDPAERRRRAARRARALGESAATETAPGLVASAAQRAQAHELFTQLCSRRAAT